MKTPLILLTAAIGLYLTLGAPVAENGLAPGYVACKTERYLNQFHNSGRAQKLDMLSAFKCLPTARLAEYQFTALADGRVRVYLSDDQYADYYVDGGAL